MPTFCRHNRLIQNCPICARELSVELRPVISSSAPRSAQPRPSAPGRRRSQGTGAGGGSAGGRGRSTGGRGGSSGGLLVRRATRGTDDGYRSPLAPGLRSSREAERLADELAFAATRLQVLAEDPPGLYAEVADPLGDLEERTWLAFLIAYLCPIDADDPFAGIEAVRTPWASESAPELAGAPTGPRSAYDAARASRTLEAYRGWAGRSGSQSAAFTGEPAWTPERRFARAYERLALPALHRDARFDLLVTLGWLGVYELEAGSLALGGDNRVTVAAKRGLGIGDPHLLERRAAELAAGCGVPLAALDLGLFNWESGERASLGLGPGAEASPDVQAAARAALGL